MSKQKKHPQGTIAQNKKARHDYFIEHKFEAGMVLAGWEVKSLRAGKAQLVDIAHHRNDQPRTHSQSSPAFTTYQGAATPPRRTAPKTSLPSPSTGRR